jgi:glutamine synthetase
MSFRRLADATVAPYLAFIARMVAGGLALHRVQSLKAVRDRTG